MSECNNVDLLEVASWRPSSELAIHVISVPWNCSADVVCVSGLHRRTVLSTDPEQIVPSLLHATVVTLSECPVKHANSLLCQTDRNISIKLI